ncbi:hypothetical protein ACZ87_02861 [Candidatus Erwinia dacicola]|uniref:Uncharacterized protein n=1 Tax=Candidatus Erwinia dacicola TaxID=252393 RepID=A0A328TRF0_9GAMM|nr:hypothetical protein ACZ87_02861 [Candidatus Erwinia dacicola]
MHKTADVLASQPKSVQPKVKSELVKSGCPGGIQRIRRSIAHSHSKRNKVSH